ncbi:alpha/beta hydrolase fold domain-containing protein [Gordonia pseudamarae]|uniref:Alpha/beta hydrolase fold domain-containing protein n=1 Tax=Gordonia pseudamarae TaxID=2831662 RepID=A0ABX6IMX0_9ACTN|nr:MULTISPECIES: alpha/beta hydrolase [Gordonia]MBD0022106.1 alpha/beta hydrolase [Gordonia sp. (in: high G+C Gram-positive bacteria)]QHN28413.1 alpha/beta hydrolase fold domain-containing protein [Gordonia pseudamarae]QHN37278.1 alpha/beta hydrolase fold domain-containing protein [Gordonia pseudamarae]
MSITRHRHSSLRSYVMFVFLRLTLRPLLALWPLTAAGMSILPRLDAKITEKAPMPRGVVHEWVTLGGRRTELSMPAGPSRGGTDTAILYLHGGAFIVAGIGTHRAITGKLARGTGLPVFALEYRQLPGVGVGTSVADALDAYRELLTERGFRRIVLAGDSAGGFLCGKVIELATGAGLPSPTAWIGYSPWLDLDAGSNPDRSSRADSYLPIRKMRRLVPLLERGPVALAGARSIVDVDPLVFPPTILITAEAELLEPDAITLAERLMTADVEVQLHSYAWQVHAFPMLLDQPQSREAIRLTAEFATAAVRAAEVADGRDEQAG